MVRSGQDPQFGTLDSHTVAYHSIEFCESDDFVYLNEKDLVCVDEIDDQDGD